jgi:hypothetical protein
LKRWRMKSNTRYPSKSFETSIAELPIKPSRSNLQI